MYSMYTAYEKKPYGFAASLLFWALVPMSFLSLPYYGKYR